MMAVSSVITRVMTARNQTIQTFVTRSCHARVSLSGDLAQLLNRFYRHLTISFKTLLRMSFHIV